MYARLLASRSAFASLALVLASLATASCSSSSSPDTPSGETTNGYSLSLNAVIKPDGAQASFMTPAASVVSVPVSTLVGKPYLVITFPAGFSPGNDPPLHQQWGVMPENLSVSYTTPATYKDGAYDLVFVVYVNTPISDAQRSASAQAAPAAVKGDLASFTNDPASIKAGDPPVALGGVRLNVDHKNASVSIENRTPKDPNDQAQLGASFSNTVMALP